MVVLMTWVALNPKAVPQPACSADHSINCIRSYTSAGEDERLGGHAVATSNVSAQAAMAEQHGRLMESEHNHSEDANSADSLSSCYMALAWYLNSTKTRRKGFTSTDLGNIMSLTVVPHTQGCTYRRQGV